MGDEASPPEGWAPSHRRALLSVWVSCVLLAGMAGWQLAAAEEGVSTGLELSADVLDVDSGLREARFSGSVQARRGEWVLRCEALRVRYDETGQLTDATSEGPVELVGPELVIEAPQAVYELTGDSIVLAGGATLRRGQSVLRAESVRVELGSGKIAMQGVKGRLELNELRTNPPAPAPSAGAEVESAPPLLAPQTLEADAATKPPPEPPPVLAP